MKKRYGFLFRQSSLIPLPLRRVESFGIAILLLFAIALAGCDNITANNTNADSTPTLLPGTYNCEWNGYTGRIVLTAMKTVSSFQLDNIELITSGMWNQTGTALTITLTYLNGTTERSEYTVISDKSFSGNGENWSR